MDSFGTGGDLFHLLAINIEDRKDHNKGNSFSHYFYSSVGVNLSINKAYSFSLFLGISLLKNLSRIFEINIGLLVVYVRYNDHKFHIY